MADALSFMLMNDFRAEDGEPLPSLFRRHLAGIEETFEGFRGLTQSFDENMRCGEPVLEPARELAVTTMPEICETQFAKTNLKQLELR